MFAPTSSIPVTRACIDFQGLFGLSQGFYLGLEHDEAAGSVVDDLNDVVHAQRLAVLRSAPEPVWGSGFRVQR
jgi:hypothetical protein